MERRYPSCRKTLLILCCLFAGPVLALADLFMVKPQTTMAMVEKIRFKEIVSYVGRAPSRTRYAFVETDSGEILQLRDSRPATAGKYLLITRSKIFGMLIRLANLDDPANARVQVEWKLVAGMAVITLLLGVVFAIKRFDPAVGIAAIIAQAVFLCGLWVYGGA